MKKSIISLLVVIVMLLGIILGMTNTVLAETPTTKTYTIIYKVDDSMGPKLMTQWDLLLEQETLMEKQWFKQQ